MPDGFSRLCPEGLEPFRCFNLLFRWSLPWAGCEFRGRTAGGPGGAGLGGAVVEEGELRQMQGWALRSEWRNR